MNRILAPPWLATVLIVMLTTLLLLAPPQMSPASHTVTVSASVLSWYPQQGTPDPLTPIAVATAVLTVLALAGTIPARSRKRRRPFHRFTHSLYHLGMGPPDLYTCESQRVGGNDTNDTSAMGKTDSINASYGARCHTPGARDLTTMATARSMPLLI